MAEVTAFRNNATDYPIYGLPWTIVFPLLDADGDPVTGETCDSEISLNGDTGADCTNEGTEITFTTATNKGMYYLTLTAAEMTCDIATVTIYAANSKATPIVLYPKKLPTLLTSENAGAYDSTTTINLGTSASAIDDYYNGCIVYIYGGTGSGQVRMITDYVGSTKLATVHVAWATNPDATSDLKVYRTEQNPYGIGVSANVTQWNGTAVAAPATAGYPAVTIKSGTGTGEISLSSGIVKATDSGGNAIAKEATLTEIKGAGFDAETDTLEQLAVAISAIPATIGVPSYYFPDSATRVAGGDGGGTYANLAAEDGSFFITQEVTTGTFLEVILQFDTGNTTYVPVSAYIPGYYVGSGAHRIDIFRYNYVTDAWGTNVAATMLPRTDQYGYELALYPRHISDTGTVKLRLLHAGSAAGIPSHYLYLDMARVALVETNGEMVAALAQLLSITQRMDTAIATNLDATVSGVNTIATAVNTTATTINTVVATINTTTAETNTVVATINTTTAAINTTVGTINTAVGNVPAELLDTIIDTDGADVNVTVEGALRTGLALFSGARTRTVNPSDMTKANIAFKAPDGSKTRVLMSDVEIGTGNCSSITLDLTDVS